MELFFLIFSESLLSSTLRYDQELTHCICASILDTLHVVCNYLEATKTALVDSDECMQLITVAFRVLFALDMHKIITINNTQPSCSFSSSLLSSLIGHSYVDRIAQIAFRVLTTNAGAALKDLPALYQCQDSVLQLLMTEEKESPCGLIDALIDVDLSKAHEEAMEEDTEISTSEASIIIGHSYQRTIDHATSYSENSCTGRITLVPSLMDILYRLLADSSAIRHRGDACASLAPILVSLASLDHIVYTLIVVNVSFL